METVKEKALPSVATTEEEQVEKTTDDIISQKRTRPYTGYLLRTSGRVTPHYFTGDDEADMTTFDYLMKGCSKVVKCIIPDLMLVTISKNDEYSRPNGAASILAGKVIYNDAMLVALNSEGYTSCFRGITRTEAREVLRLTEESLSKYGKEEFKQI